MTRTIANLSVLAGKLHYVTFRVITRNITRLSKIHVSHWFIWVFDEPGFLLIRRSLVRAQVEEPPKKASLKAMLFPFIRNYLSRWGPLGDFLPSNFIELLHVYYTFNSTSQEPKLVVMTNIGQLIKCPYAKRRIHKNCQRWTSRQGVVIRLTSLS